MWPRDVDGLRFPCRIFCGCADGWQKEPVLTDDGKVKFENVIRFENSLPDSEEKELLCMTISRQLEILEGRGKCIYSDEQIEELKSFVRENRDIIILHNAGIIDSAGFLNALLVKNDSDNHSVKYRIRFWYKENFGTISFPLTPHYVAFDDESYDEAKLFYEKLKVELKETPEEKKGDLWIEDFEVLRPEEDTGKCCFCDAVFDGRGNSTWPIYYRMDGETHRCCDKCNEEYVEAARKDLTLIAEFRKKFGISYIYERINKVVLCFITLIATFICCSSIGGIIICSIKIDFRYVTKIKEIINEIQMTGDVLECKESFLCILLSFLCFVCLVYIIPTLRGLLRDLEEKHEYEDTLYLWIREFDVYRGRNPLKLLLRWFAGKMWDYKEAREQYMIFLNKKFTPCRRCGFFKFFILSLVYKLGNEGDKEKGIEITNGFLHFGIAVIFVVLILAVIIMFRGLGLGIFEMLKELIGRY